MAGILSKNIKFSYSATSEGSYTEVANLQEIPSLGGTPDKIDVTCLGDSNKKYINGLIDYGDLAFKFLYDNSTATSNYRVLKGLTGTNYFKIEFPDSTAFAFSGEVSVSLDAAAVNAALTFTANIALNSNITVTNPIVFFIIPHPLFNNFLT